MRNRTAVFVLCVFAAGCAAVLLILMHERASEPDTPRVANELSPLSRPAEWHDHAPALWWSVAPDSASCPAVSLKSDVNPVAADTNAAAMVKAAFPKDADCIPNEFVLSFYDENDMARFMDLAKAKGCRILGHMRLGNTVRVRVKSSEQIDELLKEGPMPVEWGPNHYVRAPLPPKSTPRKPVGDYFGFGPAALEWLGVTADPSVTGAWGKGVTVAVLDTALVQHPALSETAVTRINLVDGDTEPAWPGYGGHGTAVASLIAGNGSGVLGIAPGALMLGIAVIPSDGTGDAFTLARGIVEAADKGANVINMCLSTRGDSFLLRSAVDYALGKGAALVAATGNDGLDSVSYPARYEGVLAVSAVDATGRHMFFANSGPEVDIAAPGCAVAAAWPVKEQVVAFSGTSAAAPFVSGALAALLSRNPGMTAAEAADILLGYADDSGAPGEDSELGSGVLNMRRVLDRDKKGVYDVGIGPICEPAVSQDGKALKLVLYVQNRGTELLRAVDLRVQVGGVEYNASFFGMEPGQTMSREFKFDISRLAGQAEISCSAVIDGAQDAYPADNFRKAVLTLPRG